MSEPEAADDAGAEPGVSAEDLETLRALAASDKLDDSERALLVLALAELESRRAGSH